MISAITETSDSATVYPSPGSQTATYNSVNALTNLSGQAFTYDANGNLLSDGQRNYTWDAEDRLIGITYPAQSGKATTFVYDGLSRRMAITSTPAGGGAATTSYIWCGPRPCQARTASNAVTRSYYAEGEFVPGTPAQSYYYGPDQIGSVRRVFASASSAPAYRYDPYGNALQATAPLTDFGYAGMFYNADSGLYLTQFRAYNPVTGRWLSRDPAGERTDPAANLYAYVGGNPVSAIDPFGSDTYTVNRTIGGSSALPNWDPISHTFTVTTDDDGSVSHTYSWGNSANWKGWNKDQPEDIAAANQALREGKAQRVGDSTLDPYIQRSFDVLNKKENEHMNGLVYYNCKTETTKLINGAKQLQQKSR